MRYLALFLVAALGACYDGVPDSTSPQLTLSEVCSDSTLYVPMLPCPVDTVEIRVVIPNPDGGS